MDDETELYDADMDDLDTTNMSSRERKLLKQKSTSFYAPGLQTNIGAIQSACYMLGMMATLLLFCSSLFAFLTRRELIFPERSAPKYIFDMVQTLLILVFVSFWL